MTKTEVIEAAFRAWGREFYLNTSLSQVARELEGSKPALYRHCINKQALLDAMTGYFFDDFAHFIRADYEKALKTRDSGEFMSIILRTVAEYYARNVYIFIFLMIKLQNRKLDERNVVKELRIRGIEVDYDFQPLGARLFNATLVFFIANFHKKGKTLTQPPAETAIIHIIDAIGEIIGSGLCYRHEEIAALDFGELENRIAGMVNSAGDDPLLKAVAGVVAEAGPWEASMEQVAHRSGLSKSSLYCHFKNKQDMLHQLFVTEFARIMDFARRGMRQSAVPQEQLYLGIFSIVEYLRSKPDILVAMDWIRNRGISLKPPEEIPESQVGFLRLFENIDIKLPHVMPDDGGVWLTPWILFLIINTLMQKKAGHKVKNVPNNDIRFLYRLVTLGIGGFITSEKGKDKREEGKERGEVCNEQYKRSGER
jgi:AcrR family transcriptional regulator